MGLPAAILVVGFFVLACLISTQVKAQEDLNVHGVVSDAMKQSKLSDVTVTVLSDGKELDKFTTRGNGRYEFYLTCGKHYVFRFERSGYVRRSLEIDSRKIPAEIIGAGIIMPTDMSMFAITEAMEDADLSVFDKPIGKASYDATQEDLVWDFAYTQKVKSEINSFIRNLGKKKKEEPAEDKAAAEAEALYAKLMKEGTEAMDEKSYQAAILKFEAALGVKSGDAPAQGKLAEAKDLLKKQQDAEKAQKEYDTAIARGNQEFDAGNFEKAIDAYSTALIVKPDESYPTQRIAEAEDKIAKKEAAEAEQAAYDAAMKDGDKAMGEERFEDALSHYEAALSLRDGDAKADQKRKAAQEALDAQRAAKAKEEEFQNLVAAADKSFDAAEYQSAKEKYQSALEIKPDDSHSSERIAACAARLDELKELEGLQATFDAKVQDAEKAFADKAYEQALGKYDGAIAMLDGDDRIEGDRAALSAKRDEAQQRLDELAADQAEQAAYDNAIAAADKAFDSAEYDKAQSSYEEALKLRSGASHPKERLAEITRLRDQIEQAEALEAAYTKAMEEGAKSMEAEDFERAIDHYDEALESKPGDLPAKQARDVAISMRDDKLAAMAEDEAYQERIARADARMEADELQAAEKEYAAAAKMKPEETYPQAQIVKIQTMLQERAEAEAEAARLAEIESRYSDAMQKADAAMDAESYTEAIDYYSDALDVKPEDGPARKGLAEAQQLRDEQQRLSSLDEQYSAAVKRADEKYDAEQWKDARKAYEEALRVKSDEEYPQGRIAMIDERLADIERAKQEAEDAALAQQVSALVLEGDRRVGDKDFDTGIAKYQEALDMMPVRSDIQKKIEEAEAAQLQWLEQQSAQEAYDEYIAQADKSFDQKAWDAATKKYEDALALKPTEAYPKDQIAAIAAAKEAEARKESEQAEAALQAQYEAEISKGDQQFGGERYGEALEAYRKADQLIAGTELVQDKIAKTEKAIADRDAQQSEREAYEAAIAEADALFDEADYQMARLSYEDALGILPDESHPQKRINEIDKRLEQLSLQENKEAEAAAEKDYREAIKKADSRMQSEEFESAISHYQAASEIKPKEAYPKAQIEKAQRQMARRKEEAELLAAKKQQASKPAKKEVSSRSEDQAQNFMNDAMKALELERREGVRQDKLDNARMHRDWIEAQEMEIRSNYAALLALEEQNSDIFEQGLNRYKKRSKKSTQYKKTLLENMHLQAMAAAMNGATAQKQLNEDAMVLRDWQQGLIDEQLERIRKTAVEMQLFTQEYGNYQQSRNASLVEQGRENLREQQDQFHNQLGDRRQMADVRREQNREEAYASVNGDQDDFNDFFRMSLATEYPEGVTEESSTLGNKVIITRIVVNGSRGDEYRKVLDRAGNYYFKNGQSISELTWNRETLDAYNKNKN